MSFSGFISCKLSIALRPNGVAAESNPKKLAAKFNVIYEIEGWFFGILGNTFTKTGLNTFASFPDTPEMIKSSINPQKKAK
ncbi:hypothetical protein D3C85_1155390 [compost metagenome]